MSQTKSNLSRTIFFVLDKIFCPWLKSWFLLYISSLKWLLLHKNLTVVSGRVSILCLCHLPKQFFFCLRQNILSMAKKFISAAYKSKKITHPDETVNFCTKEVIFRDLCIAKMNFLAMDKIFVYDKNFLSWTNLILSMTKHILSGQMARP